jgi:hypothetical protein
MAGGIGLVLSFRPEDFAFVYSGGRPIGAVAVGPASPARTALLFSGDRRDFEILRPAVVQSRFGRKVLERLIEQFLGGSAAARRCHPAAPSAVAEEPVDHRASAWARAKTHSVPQSLAG